MYIYHSKMEYNSIFFYIFEYVAKQALKKIKLYFEHGFFCHKIIHPVKKIGSNGWKQGLDCKSIKKKVEHMKYHLMFHVFF